MTDFLLEFLSEEIPARMQDKARADLARLFEAELGKAGLKADALETYATPRRLVLIARGLPPETAAVREDTKGPRASAPPQALEGFLRKTGLTRDQLEERDGILFAVVEKPGRATAAVLAEAVPAIVRAFPWPKSMRWGAASASTESLRWVRPLQGIVALFGEEIVEFEIAGVRSGAATVGHRFHHPGAITIGSANDYIEKLQACHVLVDQEERKRLTREGAHAAAAAWDLELIEDEGLVVENAGLTEWPVPLLGGFDPQFLDVPSEVIQLTMRTNQKYFAVSAGAGTFASNFVCTANILASDEGHSIIQGNQRVLSARLSDAKFFWEQDLKIPLDLQADKLKQIVFHEKLGTVADKVERVAKLARWLVEEGIVKPPLPLAGGARGGAVGETGAAHSDNPSATPSREREGSDLATLAERAARLSKADLVTQMVGEFPELQGIIGGHLARAQGEPAEVADAIRDHYKPVGQGDEVPTAPVTVAVSLADKLDTLIAFLVIDEWPTGSKDPYALRRAAISILSILTTHCLRVAIEAPTILTMVSLYQMINRELLESIQELEVLKQEAVELEAVSTFIASINIHILRKEIAALKPSAPRPLRFAPLDEHLDSLGEGEEFSLKVTQFFADRLKVQQREAGVRHDLIDAVFALGGEDDLVRLLARVRALQAFVETAEGGDLLAGYKRAANILRKEGWEGSGTEKKQLSYTPEDEEQKLIAALDSAEPNARAAVEAEDFEGAMGALASLRGPVDAFFDKVTVNDPDPAKREARLALLTRMRDAVHLVADFSRIEG